MKRKPSDKYTEWLIQHYATVIVVGFTSFLLALIYTYGSLALWFDESWRAYGISNFKLFDYDNGSAPVSAGIFFFTKILTLVTNNEFTQRLPSFVAALALPTVAYVFGRKVVSKNFGLLFAGMMTVMQLTVEFTPQNKPYVIDMVVTLLLVLQFHRFIENRISAFKMAAFSLLALVFSISTYWLFVGAGIYFLYDAYRTHLYKKYIVWGVITAIGAALYYHFALKGQVGGGLNHFWAAYSWKGLGLNETYHYILTNTKALFDAGIFSHSTISSEGWLQVINRLVWLSTLSLFVTGGILLIKCKDKLANLLSTIVFATFPVTFIAAYFNIWTYGNNRINAFQIALICCVASYGLYKSIEWLWQNKRHRLHSAALTLLVLGMILFNPLQGYAHNIGKTLLHTRDLPEGEGRYMEEARPVAKYLRTKVQSTDTIVTFHFMTKKGFMYYFKYYEQKGFVKAHKPKRYIFDSLAQPLNDNATFFNRLSKTDNSVWVVYSIGYGHDPTDQATQSYNIVEKGGLGSVKYVKLVRK